MLCYLSLCWTTPLYSIFVHLYVVDLGLPIMIEIWVDAIMILRILGHYKLVLESCSPISGVQEQISSRVLRFDTLMSLSNFERLWDIFGKVF